jgi:hypothetical protein
MLMAPHLKNDLKIILKEFVNAVQVMFFPSRPESI